MTGEILSIHETREAAQHGGRPSGKQAYGISGNNLQWQAKNRKLSNQQLEEIHESTKDYTVGRRVEKLFREGQPAGKPTPLHQGQPWTDDAGQ